MIDLDKGLQGLVIHHKPLTEIQIKRLLLVFDEIYFTPPEDNKFFLEKGAISYSYYFEKDKIGLYLRNGLDVMKENENVPEPEIKPGQLAVSSIFSYGGKKETGEGANQTMVLSDVLPLFNDKLYYEDESRLLNKFDYALNKNVLKVLEYRNSDFYLRNSISLKIAYDYDSIDKRAAQILSPLLVKKKREDIVMFVPSPPLPQIKGANIFPSVKYESFFPKDNNKEYDYDRQFLSIVAKVDKKLSLCGEFGLIPIFIDRTLYNFFVHKVEKSKRNKEEPVLEEWNKLHNFPMFNLSHLLVKASEVHIPDSVLKNLSIPEIVSYKERCAHELYNLRKVFIQDLNDLISSDFGITFKYDAEKFLKEKLIPELWKYQEAKNNILLNKILKNTISFSVGALSGYIGTIQGLSPTLIALLGGTTPLISEKLLQLSEKIRDSKIKRYENTFAYFINLPKS